MSLREGNSESTTDKVDVAEQNTARSVCVAGVSLLERCFVRKISYEKGGVGSSYVQYMRCRIRTKIRRKRTCCRPRSTRQRHVLFGSPMTSWWDVCWMQAIVHMPLLDAMVRKKQVTHGMCSTFLPSRQLLHTRNDCHNSASPTSFPPLCTYLLLVQFL